VNTEKYDLLKDSVL